MVFNKIYAERVMLEGLILKPSIVLPGFFSPEQETLDDIVDATVRCLFVQSPRPFQGSRSCRAANRLSLPRSG